ncbi:MAG: MoxR family ATPase [Chitinophagales bacterium]|nr:MoxR family ATPase [Chitinophagales bacterium]
MDINNLSANSLSELQLKVQEHSAFVDVLRKELSKVIVGQQGMVDRLLLALLTNGHILLEGVPGLAKTLAIKSLSEAVSVDFSRIQFTPDLLPADIIGTMIFQQHKGIFEVKKGPIFSNFVLADEINRAPAKVQSALLQAMQERTVTIGENVFQLPEPFLVMATQNPIEQEGTYPLPEAQVDRFMLKVVISYPKYEEERLIMRMNTIGEWPKIQPCVNSSEIINARSVVKEIYMDEKIEQYILDLVFATRQPEKYRLPELSNYISYGGSPRASISLAMGARAHAFLNKRAYVIPEDVKAVVVDVLRHRIGLTFEAEAELITSEQIIDKIIQRVDVP